MSETLERGAEITKLARLLGAEPKELGYLDEVPATALRTLREQVTDRLFAGDAGRLRRVAAASKLVPVPLTVKIAQIAFGPLLCAATAGLLDPPHAVKVASRCPTDFLADITVHLDPRRAPEVIAAVPTPLVVAVAKALLARDEHVTMGRFVSYLRPETLRAAVAEIPDDADILRVAFVMEGKEKLDEIVDVARDRLPGLVRTAQEQRLWAEALDLIGHLSLDNLAQLAEVAAAQGDDVLDALVRAAHELDAWDVVLPIAAAMSPESLRRVAALPVIVEPDVMRSAIATAARAELWDDVLPLVGVLPDDARPGIAAVLGDLSRTEILAALTAAARSEHLPLLVDVALRQNAEGRDRVLGVIAELDDLDEFTALLTAQTPPLVWDALLDVRDEMPARVRAALRARADDLGLAEVAAAL